MLNNEVVKVYLYSKMINQWQCQPPMSDNHHFLLELKTADVYTCKLSACTVASNIFGNYWKPTNKAH